MERTTEIRRLALALTITAIYFFAEVLGGLLTHSLALLSDAGHMFSDIAALSLSRFAFQGVFTLSAHSVVCSDGSPHAILDQLEEQLKSRFAIEHMTIQLETENREEREFQAF